MLEYVRSRSPPFSISRTFPRPSPPSLSLAILRDGSIIRRRRLLALFACLIVIFYVGSSHTVHHRASDVLMGGRVSERHGYRRRMGGGVLPTISLV